VIGCIILTSQIAYTLTAKNKIHYLLHRIVLEATCSTCGLPHGFWNVTLNTIRAFVLFFLAFAIPIRCSTSALRNFNMPTQSILELEVKIIESALTLFTNMVY